RRRDSPTCQKSPNAESNYLRTSKENAAMASASVPTVAPQTKPQSTRLMTKANALRKEFGTPFALVDVTRSAVVHAPNDFPCDLNDPACLQMVRRVALREE